jgi:plasmid stabilization system protein ParE
MVSSLLKVVIDNEAKKSLREAYLHIRKDSLQNAEKVRHKIIATIKALHKNPERHNPDKYRMKNEEGLYRAFEVYKYRITYHISAEDIRIIRIRHTKMNPLEY